MPSSSAGILEYEPPRSRLTARLGQLISTAARAVWRRKPWPAELLVLAWLVLCVANVVHAVTHPGFPRPYRPLIYDWHWPAYLIAPVLGGCWGLIRQREWRAMAICAGIVLVTGVASGALQLSSCPHATYLQVGGGFYVPVFGDPCNNAQAYYLQPWWML